MIVQPFSVRHRRLGAAVFDLDYWLLFRARHLGFWLFVALAVTVRGADWLPVVVPETNGPPSRDAAMVTYRCYVRVPDNMTSRAPVDLWTDSALFSLADIPGPFSLLLNGREIASGDGIPAEPRRRFKVPKGILEKRAFNVLALQLEGAAARHGLRVSPVLHGYHDELVLEGGWEVRTGRGESAEFQPVSERPTRGVFTEANFREGATTLARNAELVRGRRLPPADALATMRTPPDLKVDLLAHEPEIAQPTHFSFDARGRLWVAQYRQYPYPAGVKMLSRDKYYRATFDRVPPAPPYHDRGADIISVHEDTDSDGVLDRHQAVLKGLNMANAVLHGHGGIWVMHSPYLLFYPDANGDDLPDRDPEVRLAGFGLEDTHSVANGLAWGPDGWIYGAQGSTTTSRVTRPGSNTPPVYVEGCMVWRYHPDSRAYEIFADGGGNNFGLEFDAEGRVYSGHNGGQTRGWHFVQSGVYLKQAKDPAKFGPAANPYSFGEQPMMGTTNRITRFTHHFAIAEGTALPSDYLGRLFNVDPLHHNVVVSSRTRDGATFTTADSGIALESSDPAFRPVFAANAPDGSMWIADFYEEYIAHGQNYQGQIDPDSGRLYRLRGRDALLIRDVNLAAKSAIELVAILSHPSKWHRQTAVRLLGERRDPAARPMLERLVQTGTVPGVGLNPGATSAGDTVSSAHPALEALWALHQAGWLDDAMALTALRHRAGPVRAWAIRLKGDAQLLPASMNDAVLQLAATDPDAEVRCQIASTARRLAGTQALPLVAALLRRDADADDAFIPLLCWFTLESFCSAAPRAVLDVFGAPSSNGDSDVAAARRAFAGFQPVWNSRLSQRQILPRLMRRFAAGGSQSDLVACALLLAIAPDDAARRALLAGFDDAFKARPVPVLPDELATALLRAGHDSLALKVRRGDAAAAAVALSKATDATAGRDERLALIRALGEAQPTGAIAALLSVVRSEGDLALRGAAVAALSGFPDASIGDDIAAVFITLPAGLRGTALNLLASRPAWSLSLFRLIDRGAVRPADVSPDSIARLRRMTNGPVAELAAKHFPKARPALRAETQAAIQRIQQVLKSGAGNPYAGGSIFAERCVACHQLFHQGGQVGPNLTAYQRDDLSTLLPSLLDPSAEIREGYVNYEVETKDGRSLNGFLVDQDGRVVVLRGVDGQDISIRRDNIASLTPSRSSLMPDGLLDGLSDQQLRDFFAYLRIPQPIGK